QVRGAASEEASARHTSSGVVLSAEVITATRRCQLAVSSLEPPSSGGRKGVVRTPLGGDEALMLQPRQRWVQVPLTNVQGALRDLADPQKHAVPVQRSERDGLENQQVERAGAEVGGLLVHILDRLGVLPR